MDKFELDEGFRPCHPPFRLQKDIIGSMRINENKRNGKAPTSNKYKRNSHKSNRARKQPGHHRLDAVEGPHGAEARGRLPAGSRGASLQLWAVIFTPMPLRQKVLQTSLCTYLFSESVLQTLLQDRGVPELHK